MVELFFPPPDTKVSPAIIPGSMTYNAIKNGRVKDNVEVKYSDLRAAVFTGSHLEYAS